MYSRRQLLKTSLALGAGAILPLRNLAAIANPHPFALESPLIPAPQDPADWPEFRRQLAAWREARKRSLDYSGASYGSPEFTWVKRCFSCCFLMMYDEMFLDPASGAYRVSTFLDHGRDEFGGYDALVLWHAYPRIGFDERNQFDFYRDMPGGLPGMRKLVSTLHARGVRVFLNYNPWDVSTRREGREDLAVLEELVGAMEVDGIFLDTMDQGAAGFRSRLDVARRGVALESEGALPVERISDHHLSWAQWFSDSEAPGVLRNKWFERAHMQHQIKRWDRDHSGELQAAWMNGSGIMVWENVFGTWVGWNARDRSILRAMLPIQRRFADLFTGEHWMPLVPTEQAGVYASEWGGDKMRLWTLVNRSPKPVQGALLNVATSDDRFYDLLAGHKAAVALAGGRAVLSGCIPPRGIGCFAAFETSAPQAAHWNAFLAGQQALNQRAHWNTRFPAIRPKLVRPRNTKKLRQPPAGMVEIPAARFLMTTELRVRECGFYESSDERGYYWPDFSKSRAFTREVNLNRYAIDITPVTNAQFAEFMRGARYRPRHPENFLRHWIHGAPAAGMESHPVVYVDVEDARAYARWAGKRLPTEEEWQFAAEGPEHRRYPWGDEMLPDVCNGGRAGQTTAVGRFPSGRSAFGCHDLCGNIWHWTESERSDGRTRFCILKGGSGYKADGSIWYADGGPVPCGFAAKFLLMWPGLDRCSTIGFRCVADMAGR